MSQEQIVVFQRITDGKLLAIDATGAKLSFGNLGPDDQDTHFIISEGNNGLHVVQCARTKNYWKRDGSSNKITPNCSPAQNDSNDAQFYFPQPNMIKSEGNDMYCSSPTTGPDANLLIADVSDPDGAVKVLIKPVPLNPTIAVLQ